MTLILTYHIICGNAQESSKFYTISEGQFQEHLTALQAAGRIGLHPATLLEATHSENDFILTFDDATIDHLQIVAPILEKNKYRGLFFIPTSKLNQPGYLRSEQIKELANRGHTIGVHSHDHVRMDQWSEGEIRGQLQKSSDLLEEITGQRSRFFAPPGGYFNTQVQSVAMDLGFQVIRTMKWGYNKKLDLNALETIPINRTITGEKFQRILASKNQGLLYVAKEGLKTILPMQSYARLRDAVLKTDPSYCMEEIPVVIIGAGLTGLSCAYHLDKEYLLLEKETEPGGIVRTHVRMNSFLCDGTGHWLHLRDASMKALVNKLLEGQLIEHERKAVIFSHNTFTAYPFQANTYGLPREVILECLLGLLKAKHPEDFGQKPPETPANNFHEWIVRHFGEGIAKHFMVPYNEKLLGVSLQELMPQFAERFIPRPSTEDVIKGALGFSRESLGYNARFVYPRTGGISALTRAFERSLERKPRYKTEVRTINLSEKKITLSDGSMVKFKHLVNTMALPKLIASLENAPTEILAASKKLRASTVHYFDIGVRGKGDVASDYHWIYFPERDFIFYRAGSYSAVHRDAAPAGCRSYYVEMSGGASDYLDKPEELKLRVLGDMKRAKIISDDDEILFMVQCEIPYAYVVFDQNYESSREMLINYLNGQNVISTGRWGGWGYGGMEDAMLDGKKAAATISNYE